MIGTFLKRADQYIKAANFEAAEREVGFALKEEPTNIYALAYRERIHRAKLEHERELQEAEERRRKDEEYRRREREILQEKLRKYREEKEKHLPITHDSEPAPPPLPIEKTTPYSGGKLEMQVLSNRQQFRDLLARIWRSGIPSERDKELIERARLELLINDPDFEHLTAEVKAEAYINAIKVAWRQQRIIPTQPAAFEEFRRQYGVSPDEHLLWEARMLFELQNQQRHETIFYIDDDIGLTEVIEETLRDAGYKTIIATSPEQALQQLRNIVPDLILCDVRFPNSDLNGLAIYEHVRQMPQFVTVPFLFLSAVTDEHIMHAGLGSGADDYITKPFNPDTLLAIIEGKLKRYRELKRTRIHH